MNINTLLSVFLGLFFSIETYLLGKKFSKKIDWVAIICAGLFGFALVKVLFYLVNF